MTIHEVFEQIYKKNPKWDIARKMAYLAKQTRLNAGLTQHELAKKMKTKQESIARVERGFITPTLPYLDRLAKACGGELVLPVIIIKKITPKK